MNIKIIKFHIFALLMLPLLYFGFSSCGKIEGFANSGTTNTYNFVYFGSLGSSTINSYYLDSDGAIVVAANAISTGGLTANINDFVATIDGRFLYAANKASNNVSSYSINQMTDTNPGTPTYMTADAAGTGVSGLAIHPNGKFVYATNSTAVADNLSFFNVNQATGALNSADTTYTTTRLNPTALTLAPDGRFLFIANRGTSDLSVYSVNSVSGALTTVNLSVSTGTNPEDIAVHPNGLFLYSLSTGSARIYAHSISAGGALSALSPAFTATGAGPKKIAITPNGKYIYVSNNTDNTLSCFAVSSATGLFSPVALSPFVAPVGAGVYALAITSDSKFLIVSGDSNAKGYVFQIDDATGNISQVGNEISLGGSNPRTIEIIPLSAVE